MPLEKEQFFARAISKPEYDLYVLEGEIIPNTEWVKIKKRGNEKDRGFGLRFLKEDWVDRRFQRSGGDVYDVIIGVRSEIDEFIVRAGVTPARHVNLLSLPMERTRIIYDPRKIVVPTGVDLDLKNPTKLLK